MRIIDSHSHFDDACFDTDRAVAYRRAIEAGVVAQIVPAVKASDWSRLRAVVAHYPGLHAAYGLHPMLLSAHRQEHLIELRRWIERERPVAVGECGLDFFVKDLDPQRQLFFFAEQLRIARDMDLPVIIHARRAVDQVTAQLRRTPGLRGVVHSFSGSEQQARKLAELGFKLGLGGPLGYERARRLRRLAAKLPLEFFVLETDSPDQPGPAHRGERNEPSNLPEVLRDLARLRDTDPGEIAAVTGDNVRQVFGPTVL